MQNFQQSNPNPLQQPPDNYLVWAILYTVFCCLPLGIVSIIKSSQVNTKWQVGDYNFALKASSDAKKYALWGAIIGFILLAIYLIFLLVVGFNIANSEDYSNTNF